jgi:O-methyltransferase
MIKLLKKIHRSLPGPVQNVTRKVLQGQRALWIRDQYTAFGREERRRIFLSIARFMHINRPIPGYYFEFGCNEANTMRMAWDAFHHLFDLTYVGFDSFEGLPGIEKIDEQEIWEKGKLAYAEDLFVRTVTAHGMPRDKLITVKGFYDATLNDKTAQQFRMKAAVIYVDCDLYQSTVPVLKFIRDFLQPGTVIVFDDWNCFLADPDRGERRAWREFRERYPELAFEEFVATGEQKAFVYTGALPDRGAAR